MVGRRLRGSHLPFWFPYTPKRNVAATPSVTVARRRQLPQGEFLRRLPRLTKKVVDNLVKDAYNNPQAHSNQTSDGEKYPACSKR